MVKFDISRLIEYDGIRLIYVEGSDTIQAPRDEVFASNADFRNWAGAFPGVSSVRLVKEHYEERVFEVFDSVKDERYTIVQRVRAPEKIVREIRRRTMTGKATYTLTVTTEGTRITFTMSASLRGYYRLLGLFMKGQLSKSLITYFLEPVKRVAEARGQRLNSIESQARAVVNLNGHL